VKAAAAAAVLALISCAPAPRRPFSVGLAGPVTPRLAAEARRLGLSADENPPAGSSVEASAPAVGPAFPRARLRFLAARAVARGASGVYFLPPAAESGDILDFPEEWQALARVFRELLSARPLIETGEPREPEAGLPAGVEARAWLWRGRRYLLIVNSSTSPAPLPSALLAERRALFAARADAREALAPCGPDLRCVPPEGVLWLEGRLLR
jgi:hypothetical protein